MARFSDREGQSWIIDLNTTALKRLRANGMDLLAGLDDGTAITKMISDPIYLVDMIYLLCKKQADDREISDEDFGVLVGKGDTLEEANKALLEEITLFFRSRGDRSKGKAIELAMQKYEQMEDRMLTKAMEKIEDIDLEEIEKRFGESLTNALATSELTREPLPSENLPK